MLVHCVVQQMMMLPTIRSRSAVVTTLQASCSPLVRQHRRAAGTPHCHMLLSWLMTMPACPSASSVIPIKILCWVAGCTRPFRAKRAQYICEQGRWGVLQPHQCSSSSREARMPSSDTATK